MIADPHKPWPHRDMVKALKNAHTRYAEVSKAAKDARAKCASLKRTDPNYEAALTAAAAANERLNNEAFRLVGAVEAVLGVFP